MTNCYRDQLAYTKVEDIVLLNHLWPYEDMVPRLRKCGREAEPATSAQAETMSLQRRVNQVSMFLYGQAVRTVANRGDKLYSVAQSNEKAAPLHGTEKVSNSDADEPQVTSEVPAPAASDRGLSLPHEPVHPSYPKGFAMLSITSIKVAAPPRSSIVPASALYSSFSAGPIGH